jgi:AmmeMemoRadiSam system protein A
VIDGGTRHRLLGIAREHLEARVHRRAVPVVPAGPEVASSGVFVTLYCRRELRGCLGSMDAGTRLVQAIARLAASVCCEDTRFQPLRAEELPDSAIELSLLTLPERVVDVAAIEVGRHGLIVERGPHKGLLLPQVAREQAWDRDRFLDHTCLKAGLSRDAWRHDAVIYAFEAEVFGELGPAV